MFISKTRFTTRSLIIFWALLGVLIASIMFPPGSVIPNTSAFDGTHPRLFFDESQIATLQAQAATTHQAIWTPIYEYAASLIGTVPPVATPVGADESTYVNYGNQIIPLAFACVISNEDKICDLAKTYLLTFANWTQWNTDNLRGLGHAHMLSGSALAYDWLYNRLTPEEQQVARQSLAIWAQRMYEASSQPFNSEWANWWVKSYLQNHYWIANSALGTAGLALWGEEELPGICTVRADNNVNQRAGPGIEHDVTGTLQAGQSAEVSGQTVDAEGFIWWQLVDGTWVRSDVVSESAGCEILTSDAQAWIDQARNKLSIGRDILNGIRDGTWHESTHYQNYFLAMSLPFMTNLRKLQKTDILPHIYLQNYVYWRIYNYLPGSTQVALPYGDFQWSSSNSFKPQNVLRFVASEYDDGRAEWMAREIIAADGRLREVWAAPWYVFEFLYYDPTITPQSPRDLPGARTFEDLEAVIWRTGWDENALVFGLKTGGLGGRFAFDTFTSGLYPWEPPCIETGCSLNIGHEHNDANSFYLYNSGHWLAPEAVGVTKTGTALHNTLLIDGKDQYRPPDNHYGMYAEEYVGRSSFIEAVADSLSFDYLAADTTQRYDVAGVQDITRYVVFVRPDYFVMLDAFAANAPHQVEWVSHFSESVSVEGNWIRGDAGDGQILGVAVVSPQSFETVTGSDDGYPFVHTRPGSSVDNVRLIHILYPTEDSAWDERPAIEMLGDNGQAVAVRVRSNDGSGRVDDILLSYAQPAVTQIGPYMFDGRVAVVSRGPDGALQKLFVFGGTFLAEVGEETTNLVSGLTPTASFEVQYHNETATVSGDLLSEITLTAPQVERVMVNDAPWSFNRSGDTITLQVAYR
ncbi:MAG: heparinase II/III family protein [Anaerolineae bacterium]|nr:heparinase II/III family protein [Anaerolineae bacterium]